MVWQQRGLTLSGKVYIAKSLGLSNFNYAFECRSPKKEIITKIETLVKKFVWSNKRSLINQETCKQPVFRGGLGLIDLNIYIKSRRIKLVVEIITGELENWKILPRYYFRILDSKYRIPYFLLFTDYLIYHSNKIDIPLFYKECVKTFIEFRKKFHRKG